MRPKRGGTDPFRDMVAVHLAARAHAEAYPGVKRAATRNGVTPRTARRWRSPEEAKGSPLHTYHRYLASAEHPWRLVAANYSAALEHTVRAWPTDRLIREYRAVLARDKAGEAVDTQHDLDPTVPWETLAESSERDAADDLLKAACEREFAARRIPRARVVTP